MENKINSILIHDDDNVITVTELLKTGSVARYWKGDKIIEIITAEEIPKFHKIAVTDIHEKENVYKYGQLIGVATQTIKGGSHVHDHNIKSPK